MMHTIDEELKIAEEMRSELSGYCYRMTGSFAEAEDAVQDTLLRIWQSQGKLRNQAALRTWIYRIATNVCLDKLRNAKRRALPIDVSDPANFVTEPQETVAHPAWIWPYPDLSHDPAEQAISRDTIRLSFIALLQTLPPKQRAVLILNDVFRWPAKQTAETMDMTVTAVNSALQRARATLKQARLQSETLRNTDDKTDERLLATYVEAFEQYDVDKLLSLFQEGASLSMPPYVMWVSGTTDILSFYEATRSHCEGSRLLPVRANGNCPAFAHYMPTEREGMWVAWGVHVLEIKEGQIIHIHHFIDSDLFAQFGMPETLDNDR